MSKYRIQKSWEDGRLWYYFQKKGLFGLWWNTGIARISRERALLLDDPRKDVFNEYLD